MITKKERKKVKGILTRKKERKKVTKIRRYLK